MPACVICESRFSPQADETCECTMELTAEQAMADPDREVALTVWWAEHGGDDIDVALAAWRASA